MSRFRAEEPIPVDGGGTLTVMIQRTVKVNDKGDKSSTKDVNMPDKYLCECAAQTLDTARKYLSKADEILNKKTLPAFVDNFGKTYFRTDDKFTNEELKRLKLVLVKTRTGLVGNVIIKTAPALSLKIGPNKWRFNDFNGQVIHKLKEDNMKGKPYYTFSHDQEYDVPTKIGAIHIRSSRLAAITNGLSSKTLIHEGTHKYAETEDYAYFENGKPDKTINREETFNNADSYAWFFYHIARQSQI